MQLSRLLFRLAWLLLPLAITSTTWLYLYPLFHGCAFPSPSTPSSLDTSHASSGPRASHAPRAPFRLLALGDPQLEGDSSLPSPSAPLFPSLQNILTDLHNSNYDPPDVLAILSTAAKGALADLAAAAEGYRKTLDLWGNDLYLAHIVRSLRWWTEPTHIAVLGDLLGSQWISDGEFEKRAGRYWGRVMRGLGRVDDTTMGVWVESDYYDELEEEREGKRSWGGTTEVLGENKEWERRVINIAGNHDIGYAGDIDEERVERFERAFGSVNWDVWFTLPMDDDNNTNTSTSSTSPDTSNPPALRLIILNSMNLDTPAYTPSLQSDTYTFLNHLISTSRPVSDPSHATILLTHIPLHKAPGICADSPYFDFFEGGSGVREQNMLSEHASRGVLEGVFGLSGDKNAEGGGRGRAGVVVNGHDHVGCDVLHWVGQGGRGGCGEEELAAEDVGARGDGMEIERVDGVVVGNTTAIDHTTETQEPDPQQHRHEQQRKEGKEQNQGWQATPFPPPPHHSSSRRSCTPSLREITLRSMMGDYHGYAGFLSAWYDTSRGEKGEWVIEFSSCGVGVQHWWWGVHVLDLVFLVAVLGGGGRRAELGRGRRR